ncbi:MAG: GIY-YIG nuclease family protein [Bdellovibrionales bacterium]|nr:GIY-YIG nuclease family protein [Bdellovibrionales bacterium]
MSWYVYIILTSKEKLYTGISTDPERRFVEHLCDKKKGAKFFRSDSPVKIVHLEEYETMSEALKREIAIKKFSSQKKRELFI